MPNSQPAEEQLAPPFPTALVFQDIDPQTLDEELHPVAQTMQADLWDQYLHRILPPHTPDPGVQ